MEKQKMKQKKNEKKIEHSTAHERLTISSTHCMDMENGIHFTIFRNCILHSGECAHCMPLYFVKWFSIWILCCCYYWCIFAKETSIENYVAGVVFSSHVACCISK